MSASCTADLAWYILWCQSAATLGMVNYWWSSRVWLKRRTRWQVSTQNLSCAYEIDKGVPVERYLHVRTIERWRYGDIFDNYRDWFLLFILLACDWGAYLYTTTAAELTFWASNSFNWRLRRRYYDVSSHLATGRGGAANLCPPPKKSNKHHVSNYHFTICIVT